MKTMVAVITHINRLDLYPTGETDQKEYLDKVQPKNNNYKNFT